MKPIQVGLLVVVAALGGALVMKMTHRPAPAPAVTAETPAPAPPAVAPPAEAPAPVAEAPPPVVEPKPSPVAEHKTVRPKPAVAKTAPPPAPVVQEVKQTAAAAPPPPPPPPPPVESAPVPPARQEPVVATPAPRPPEPHVVTLNAGLLLPVRLVDGLTTARNQTGDIFTGTLDKELVVDGFVIAERGARVQGKVVSADRGGKVKGVASLAVALTRLQTSDGQDVMVETDTFERLAKETHKQDAAKVGGGAALGAIIGAIAGGGKGAAIGAATGGAAGGAGVLLTRGEDVRLTSETRINFRLRSPVTITERR